MNAHEQRTGGTVGPLKRSVKMLQWYRIGLRF